MHSSGRTRPASGGCPQWQPLLCVACCTYCKDGADRHCSNNLLILLPRSIVLIPSHASSPAAGRRARSTDFPSTSCSSASPPCCSRECHLYGHLLITIAPHIIGHISIDDSPLMTYIIGGHLYVITIPFYVTAFMFLPLLHLLFVCAASSSLVRRWCWAATDRTTPTSTRRARATPRTGSRQPPLATACCGRASASKWAARVACC